jgi:hypothetical protein
MKNKVNHRVRLRVKLSRSALVISTLFIGLFVGFLLYFNLSNNKNAIAAVTDEYRSVQSGNWNSTSTWQRYNGSSWVAATYAPTSSRNIITIQSGHTVTITANVTVDQVVVAGGGNLHLNSGITMTLANGTGTDLNVSGTFRNAGVVSISSYASIAYQNGGTYQHNYTTTAGTIPNATWNNGSTCEIMGYTSNSTSPSGLQTFHHFTWNCPSQSSVISLNGGLTNVNGTFNIVSTGSEELRLATNGSTLNAGGFSQTGGIFTMSAGSSQTSTLNVSGNFSLSGGTFSVVNGSGSTGNINLSGNYSHTGGTLTHGGNSSTYARISFVKSGTQTFSSSGGSVTENIDYVVNSGSTLDMGNSICTGRNFTLSSGGEIIMGSPEGITSSGSSGNVQVSGTRSFHSGAEYTYAGSTAQVTGNALPSSVYRLTINNSSGLTLNSNQTITNRLILTNGRIFTGSHEISITSSSSSSVTGQSNSSYVVGNLRRAMSGTGTYSFPVGSDSMYELLTLSTSSTTGFSSVVAGFVNSAPLNPSYPLTNIEANYIEMDSMLNYGYWTLTPNASLGSGTFSVTLNQQGYSNALSSKSVFTVVRRNDANSSWEQSGTHSNASPAISGGVATAIRSGQTSFGHFGIAYGQFLAFANPTLIAGSNGQVGAIYLFPNVCNDIDAWMEIVELAGGATLDAIDNSSTGYNEAFQPFINIAPNTTSSIQWRITFKVAGTSQDTTVGRMSMTGIDVDGGSNIREFIEATMPYSYSIDLFSTLTILNILGSYRAISGFATVNDIDTSHHEAMYQLNYRNVNSILYRTGGISTKSSTETRQTSLYFRSFMSGTIALPIKLAHFNARLTEGRVELDWATASEINNDFFTIERSGDGKNFNPVTTVQGAGNSTVMNFYESIDREPLGGVSYYRLKQTDFDGKYTYSQVVTIKNGISKMKTDLMIQSVSPNPFENRFTLAFTKKTDGPVKFILMNGAGRILSSQVINSEEGYNTFEYENNGNIVPGIYFIVLMNNDQKIVHKVIKE